MKILMLTSEFPPFRGGIATYAAELAGAAAALGHEVTLAAPDYGADQSAEDAARCYRVVRFPGGPNTARAILDKIRWTRRTFRQGDYDIVHAIDWPFFLPLALSRFRGRARCILTFHGTEINMMARPSRRPLLSLLRFWNGWAEYVANSRFTGEHLFRLFPEARARGRLRAVPLGVKLPAGVQTPQRQAARREAELAQDDIGLLTVGRLVERKGHHLLVEAWKRLPDSLRARIVWHVVGPDIDPDYAARVKQAAQEAGMRARFTGPISAERLEGLFAASDLFCLPSIWAADGQFEGFGLVFLEAGLRGVPAVGTLSGGIPDAVIDGQTGLLVPESDVAALATALQRLCEDDALRARLAAQAKAYAENCTWEYVAAQTYAE